MVKEEGVACSCIICIHTQLTDKTWYGGDGGGGSGGGGQPDKRALLANEFLSQDLRTSGH